MEKGFILALDQSTSGTKTMIVDENGDIIVKASLEHGQHYPRPGWVEHDPVEIYENSKKLLADVLVKAKLEPGYIKALAITNQRETIVLWDKNTGLPVYNAIVWQCRRTSDMCEMFKKKDLEKTVNEKTGLLLDPYFSATKIKWILDNVEGVREKAEAGQILMGTIDSWLIWKLTGGVVHATDYTNASRTLLFNIRTLCWDKELIKLFGIYESMLPEIKYSDDIFGFTAENELFDASLPITGVIGDSQGALFGQNCFEAGMVKATYGTGSSIMMNIGSSYKEVGNGLVTSVAWGMNGKVEYAIEGIVHCSGDALKWVKDNLGLFQNFEEARNMVDSLESNEGVYLIPAFVGLGIPYWDSNARAAVVGMSRGTRKEHVVRAAIESTAYQIKDAIDTMTQEAGIKPKEIRVDGGPTRDAFLMQFQADMLDIPVKGAETAELSSMGSVYLAGLAVGIWDSKEEIKSLRKDCSTYTPEMDSLKRGELYQGWKVAVKRVLG
ncbi:MAG: carbohydrate kinase [Eubacterium sp.]|nr:carbohydrate kinase [Eubacterium sp.]